MNYRYDLVTNRAYIDQSWLNYKADNLWTDNDGHYEWFVQEICTHLRLENDWRSAWGSYCDDLSRRLADQAKRSPDCGVATGTLHSNGLCRRGWSRDQQRFVLPPVASGPVERIPHGEPIPTEIWARAIATLKAHHEAGLAWIVAQRPRSGILYAQFCEAEEAYNQKANAIWFAKWTRDQRAEWACTCAENVSH